ncbi:uncharacterized protein RB166_007464 [Leptodactylus fuscus]|uniref:uncharacterized protein LOC142190107 n=1 Tax=Leptodactylus fuscus TaxID=238119 RepID=UPI003F4EBFA5
MEDFLLILYFSFFICLCALVCLYFSGCQELTYKHEDVAELSLSFIPLLQQDLSPDLKNQ